MTQAAEYFDDMHFPLAGIDLLRGFERQNPRQVFEGHYARSTPAGVNVRAFELGSNRARGAVRGGLQKYIPTQPAGSALLQELNIVIKTSSNPVELNTLGRNVILIAVSGGNVYVSNAGSGAWASPTNNTAFSPPLNANGLVLSAVNNQKLYFADGSNWAFYTSFTNSVETWKPSAGILPVDPAGNTPRLIVTWRGRTVLSGLLFDPQNWFMSAVGDPTNFDYAPLSVTAAQAVAGNNSSLGLVGDVVTTMIPFNDDVLIFGGDHTIWLLQGDPLAGGQLDLVSDAIGMAFGVPWCKDPFGAVYFVSNRMGIYSWNPGQGPPQRISQPIEQLLQQTDTGANTFRMIWDDRYQGLHVFITPTAAPAAATHYFWEARVQSWWQDQFFNSNHNPLCATVFDGNVPGDRVALIGSWDGFVRYLNPNATNDDGWPINSSVLIGPLLTKDFDVLLCKDLQAVLGETSGSVQFKVFVGTTAESAISSSPVTQGTWTSGRNFLNTVRRAGHAIFVQISASNPWALEAIRARIVATGKVRRRGVKG